jgi:tRNA (cytidine/uridine-2'-O-)-methyltransferase
MAARRRIDLRSSRGCGPRSRDSLISWGALPALDQVAIVRHTSWSAFEQFLEQAGRKLVVFTTRASVSCLDHRFGAGEVLLFGRESAGVPDPVHARADARLRIPMRPGLRSINVAVACAMALGEALQKTHAFRTSDAP